MVHKTRVTTGFRQYWRVRHALAGFAGAYGVEPMPDEAKAALNETTRVFGERVRERRLALRLSQEAAAVRCGIHWTQLGKVERGERSLRLKTIVKIAAGLEIVAGKLVDGLPASAA
jgi:ribosome-binding protein aMBF1 (putative translation factor)